MPAFRPARRLANDPAYPLKRQVAISASWDMTMYVARCRLEIQFNYHQTNDTAELARANGRNYMDEHRGCHQLGRI